MAEEAQATEPQQPNVAAPAELNPFSTSSWSEMGQQPDAPAAVPENNTEPPQQPANTDPAPPAVTEDDEYETLDVSDYLKREFSVTDINDLKREREEYQALKQQASKPAVEFANEQSKQIYELIREGKSAEVKKYLETQELLNEYSAVDVTKDNADSVLRVGMKIKYPNLSDTEIDFKLRQDYPSYRQPVQSDTETDEDFSERMAEFEQAKKDTEMRKVIEAKLLQPDLNKAKANIVLPEIAKPEPVQETVPQELLEQQQKRRNDFLNALESNYAKVEGFSTKVKDESVEIPVDFKIPDEAKVALKERLQTEGFDINQFIDSRWFDENGNARINQIFNDLYLLENTDKVLAGVANNAATKRLAEHIKQAQNINLNNNAAQQTFTQPAKTVSPFSKEAWSEKPPALVNN